MGASMKLYAAGFNAFGQLSGDDTSSTQGARDLRSFVSILEGDNIERPVSTAYSTIVRCDSKIIRLGADAPRDSPLEQQIKTAHASNGSQLYLSEDFTSVGRQKLIYSKHEVSGNRSWNPRAIVKEMAAYDTGFAVLYADGTVETFGDGRYPECLGRDITESAPAEQPCQVAELVELNDPITHISAGGYIVAALTRGGSIYAWGRDTKGVHRHEQVFSSMEAVPNYMEVDGDKDIIDFAVGDAHAIALSDDRCIYVKGDNLNGQLGLGTSASRSDNWQKLEFTTPEGYTVRGIAAGPRTTFILVTKAV